MPTSNKYVVVVTRSNDKCAEFSAKVESLGFRTCKLPSIEIIGRKLSQTEDECIQDLFQNKFNWLVLTSPNGVQFLHNLVEQSKTTSKKLPSDLKIAVQGEGTSEKLQQMFARKADLLPKEFVGEALVAAFADQNLQGQRVLLAGASKTRGVLQAGLCEFGAVVSIVALYDTVSSNLSKVNLGELENLDSKTLVFTFFSPSAVTATQKLLIDKDHLLKQAKIVSVGPVTSRAIVEGQLQVSYEARDHSEAGVLDILKTQLK